MQQFTALLKKEILSYFRSSLAYFIFFVYLFVSVGAAFYFGAYLAMHDAGVYALFYDQPIILAAIIPAVTMKLWSEEYRSGTIEFLLTQPMRFSLLVLAKFTAAVLFCVFMSLFLLPFVLYTAGWLNIDAGAVVLSFFGLWMVMLMFCALGCLISAFNRSVIITYILSAFVLALWAVLPYSFLYQMYNSFLFAELGLPDVFYFISFAAAALLVNVVVLEFKRTEQKYRVEKFSAFSGLVLLATVLLNVIFCNFLAGKADFSAARFYTPHPASREIISQVTQSVTIDIYAAADYVKTDADYFHYLQQVWRFARKYEQLSGGMITVSLNYVPAFSELEEKVLENGLYFEENSRGSRNYLGAIIRDRQGREVVIKQFLLERRPFLERDIDTALLKVLQPERVKTVGVYMDAKQNLSGLQGAMLALENDYNVINAAGSIYEFSKDVDLLVFVNPKRLPAYMMYALDQFIMRGGKVALFFDFYTSSQSSVVNNDDVQIVDFLNRWQVSLQTVFSDVGQLDAAFRPLWPNIRMNKAVVFENKNALLSVQPFINSDEGMLGAVLEGKFDSIYGKNPYADSDMGKTMKPHLSHSVQPTKVAFVGDVDFLEDTYWIDGRSPDKNPYSVIETAGNGQAFKSLVDYMLGNEVYHSLPYNDRLLNRDSIGQLAEQQIYKKYEAEYTALQNDISVQRLALFAGADEDFGKMNELMQLSEVGRSLAKQEKKLQNMAYTMQKDYSAKVRKIMTVFILIWPLFVVLLLALGMRFVNKYYQRKAREIFSE